MRAEWDVSTFVKLRDEAQRLYDEDRYDDALPRYRVLESMIEEALTNGEIPEAQQPAAREALDITRYQIGRSLQGLDDCAAALATYDQLAGTVESAEVVVRLEARRPEARLCLARQLADAERTDDALTELTTALTELDALPAPDTLSEENAAIVVEARQGVTSAADTLRGEILEARVQRARLALDEARCEDARSGAQGARAVLSSAPTPERLETVDTLERDANALCQRQADDAAAAEAAAAAAALDAEVDIPIGPIVTLSVGAAILIGDAVFEGVVAADHVDSLDAAQTDCRSRGLRCDEVLSLSDSVETDRIVSIALLATGGAAVLAGATWWIVDAALDDGSATEPDEAAAYDAAPFVAPDRDGAIVGLTWTLP